VSILMCSAATKRMWRSGPVATAPSEEQRQVPSVIPSRSLVGSDLQQNKFEKLVKNWTVFNPRNLAALSLNCCRQAFTPTTGSMRTLGLVIPIFKPRFVRSPS
jgi:hypothetical protein